MVRRKMYAAYDEGSPPPPPHYKGTEESKRETKILQRSYGDRYRDTTERVTEASHKVPNTSSSSLCNQKEFELLTLLVIGKRERVQ